MDTSWDRIQDALAAAIRGDERPPVVSQRTLFGIPSTVEVQMAKFAAELAHERAGQGAADREDGESSEGAPNGASAYERELRRGVKEAACAAGDALLIGRGMRYFIFDGRESGFDIPAYPFDPKGEFKDFLRERGVRNLPEYYAALGVPSDRYEDVSTHALLVFRNPDGTDRAILLRGAEFCDATRFVPLAESRFLEMCTLSVLERIAAELHVELPSAVANGCTVGNDSEAPDTLGGSDFSAEESVAPGGHE